MTETLGEVAHGTSDGVLAVHEFADGMADRRRTVRPDACCGGDRDSAKAWLSGVSGFDSWSGKAIGRAGAALSKMANTAEWAYAGIVFDGLGAFFSHAAVRDATGATIAPLVFLVFAGISYSLHPALEGEANGISARSAMRTGMPSRMG